MNWYEHMQAIVKAKKPTKNQQVFVYKIIKQLLMPN